MNRRKPWNVELWNNLALLAWALVLAFVLSLILFGVMYAGAYVVDEFYTSN
jgi:hypothetical protein